MGANNELLDPGKSIDRLEVALAEGVEGPPDKPGKPEEDDEDFGLEDNDDAPVEEGEGGGDE